MLLKTEVILGSGLYENWSQMIVVVHADRKTLRRKTQKDWEFEGSRGYTFSGLSSLLGERRLIKSKSLELIVKELTLGSVKP